MNDDDGTEESRQLAASLAQQLQKLVVEQNNDDAATLRVVDEVPNSTNQTYTCRSRRYYADNSALKASSHVSLSRKSLVSEEDLFQSLFWTRSLLWMGKRQYLIRKHWIMKRLNQRVPFCSRAVSSTANTTNKKTASTARKSFGHVRVVSKVRNILNPLPSLTSQQ